MLIPSIENNPCIYVSIVIHPINQNKPPVWGPFGRYTIVCKLLRTSTHTYKLRTHETLLQLDVKMTTTNGNQHIKWVYLFLTNVNLCMKCVIRVFISTFVYFSKFCNVFYLFFFFNEVGQVGQQIDFWQCQFPYEIQVKLDNKLINVDILNSDNAIIKFKFRCSIWKNKDNIFLRIF